MKRIGFFIPPKTPESGSIALLEPDDIAEFKQLLEKNFDCEIIENLDLRYAHALNGKVYVGDLCLSDLDLFFWYYHTDKDRSAFDIRILLALADTTLVIPNPWGYWRGLDKFTAHHLLRNAGIPTSDFCLFPVNAVHDMRHQLEPWSDILLKPPLGAFGHGIARNRDWQSFVDTLQYAQSFTGQRQEAFCERFIPNDISKWISTTVIGSQVVYGYRKKPEKFIDGWKVYDPDCLGGDVYYVNPAPLAPLAIKASQTLGTDMVSFDWVFSEEENQYYIVDENTFPGLYSECFAEAGKGSLAENLLRLVKERLKGDAVGKNPANMQPLRVNPLQVVTGTKQVK